MSEPTPPMPASRKRGLGRGLEALLGPASALPARGDAAQPPGDDSAALLEVDVQAVDPNPEQPRRVFDEDELAGLAASIRTHGLLHPIVVERAGARFQLVAGERRLRAARLAGLSSIAAIVRPAMESARQSLEVALTENLVRSDLSPMEEAAAYARLADTFGLSHEAIALRLGRSRPAVTNTIRLLGLAAPIQRAVAAGQLSAGHARALLAVPDDGRQEAMAERAIAAGWSVRQVEQAAQAALGRRQPPLPRTPQPLSPDEEALRRGLEQAIGLPVELEPRGRGGRVVVTYAGDEDLDALYRRLGGPPL
jgi:ParB family chromosome partitioning protein